MHGFRRILLSACCLACSTAALSQDLFSSTNSTIRSYNYVEAQYLLNMEASPPVMATVLVDVMDNWSVKAEYLNLDYGNFNFQIDPNDGREPVDVLVTASSEALSVGGLYHRPFGMIEQTDWIAGFMIGRLKVIAEAPDFNIRSSDTTNFQEVYAGLRHTFSAGFEGEFALNVYRDSDNVDISGDVKLVFRVLESFDIALSGNELALGNDVVGVGLRYTW